jgi:hypothetical protein
MKRTILYLVSALFALSLSAVVAKDRAWQVGNLADLQAGQQPTGADCYKALIINAV